MIRLVEMKSNIRTKKRHSKNQSPISLEAVLAIKTMKEPESDLKEKESHSILKKKDFSSRTDLSIFTSTVLEFLDCSIKQAEFFQKWNQIELLP